MQLAARTRAGLPQGQLPPSSRLRRPQVGEGATTSRRGDCLPAAAGGDTTRPSLESVEQYKMHDNDTGSPEVQVALLTGRVAKLTEHLRKNPKDYASQRGLKKILSQRFRQLKYLHQVDQRRYHKLISDLGLRNQVES